MFTRLSIKDHRVRKDDAETRPALRGVRKSKPDENCDSITSAANCQPLPTTTKNFEHKRAELQSHGDARKKRVG